MKVMSKTIALSTKKAKWDIKPFFVNHRIKQTYTRIYFIPTLVYMYDHHESYFDPGSFHRWKLSFKFLVFGFGFWITKEVNG